MNSVTESSIQISPYELMQGLDGLDFSSLPPLVLLGSTSNYQKAFNRTLGGKWENTCKGEWSNREADEMIFSRPHRLFAGIKSTPSDVRSFIRVSRETGYTAIVTDS